MSGTFSSSDTDCTLTEGVFSVVRSSSTAYTDKSGISAKLIIFK